MVGFSCLRLKRRHSWSGVAFRLHGPFAFYEGLAFAFRLTLRFSFCVRFAFAFGLALVAVFAFRLIGSFAFRLILRRRYQSRRRFLQVRPLTLIVRESRNGSRAQVAAMLSVCTMYDHTGRYNA